MPELKENPTSKSRLHQFRSAPIALVVQAEVDGEAVSSLKELQDEAKSVSDLLFAAGYDVHILASGKYSEITGLLKDADIRERLVIFHYCGHANGQFVELKNDDGSRLSVSADAIAGQMASDTEALRLVYMNACLTDDQEKAYRQAFPKVNFIGSKIKLPDWFARKFAESFYTRFLGLESNSGQVRIRHALQTAASEDMGWKPERVDVVFQMTFEEEDKTQNVAVAELPDLNFRADDGIGLVSRHVLSDHHRRSPNIVLIYAAAIIAIQFVFMWCATGWNATSSPAFQLAFGYAPDCSTIVDMQNRIQNSNGDDMSTAFIAALGQSMSCNDSDAGLPRQPNYGVFVEWTRSIFLSMVLVLLCTGIYRRLPRDYPLVFTRETSKWLRLPQNVKYLVLFTIGVLSIVAYHTTFAHKQLSQTNLSRNLFDQVTWLQARWPVYAEHIEFWSGFDWLIEKRDEGDDLYYELYVRPYLYYMGYSLVNYLGTALPILTVIVNGLWFGRFRICQRLAGLRVTARLTLDGHYQDGVTAERRLAEAHGEMAGQFDRFVLTFLLLTLFALYEMLVGKTTTALFAQIVMFLVFLLVLVGTATILNVWNTYRDEISRISELVNAIDDIGAYRRLRRFEKSLQRSYLPLNWRTVALGLLASSVFAYLLVILAQGSHWTAFTHDFPAPFF